MTSLHVCSGHRRQPFFILQKKLFLWFPSYPPNLRSCDPFLFLNIKIFVNGLHFGPVDSIRRSLRDELKAIPVLLRRLVATSPPGGQGNYFEGGYHRRIQVECITCASSTPRTSNETYRGLAFSQSELPSTDRQKGFEGGAYRGLIKDFL